MGEKSEVIIDTDILIKIYRGNKEHKRVLQDISPNLIISCITQMELLTDWNNKKMQDEEVEENLRSYKILLLNSRIITIANEIIKKYSFSHKMSVADNLIAATALFYSIELYTNNKKHFDFIEELTLFSSGTR